MISLTLSYCHCYYWLAVGPTSLRQSLQINDQICSSTRGDKEEGGGGGEEEIVCYGMPFHEALTFHCQQEAFVLLHSLRSAVIKEFITTFDFAFFASLGRVWLEDQMEIAHMISVKSHPMLKKVSAIIEAFKERAVLTWPCVICFIVEERMLMLKDKTDQEGTIRRTYTIDRTHYRKGQETHLQQHEWSKKRFRIPSLPSPISSPNICLPHGTLYLQVRAVRMTIWPSADRRMKFPQSDTFIRPLTVLTFCDLCPFLQYKHI